MRKKDLKEEIEELLAERDELFDRLARTKELLSEALIIASEEEDWEKEEEEEDEDAPLAD